MNIIFFFFTSGKDPEMIGLDRNVSAKFKSNIGVSLSYFSFLL